MRAARHLPSVVRVTTAITSLLLMSACETVSTPASTVRAAPRHPIQTVQPDQPRSDPRPGSTAATSRTNPGPNSRVSPTPDMAPRVSPADRPNLPSSQKNIDDLRRDLEQQRKQQPVAPGPPVGTIDQRPGTIRTNPGTIEVPR
ncbi:hypothetical protein [Thalassobaculum sp.]|uniref:hypothetical protein n=1 Tax=Thalassobaculum sp. TaxID=2022740 RepID=UPI0032EDD6B8